MARVKPTNDLLGFGLVLAAGSLFGTLGIVSRFAYELGLAPAALVAWRSLFGFIGLSAIVLVGLQRGRRLIRRRDLGGRCGSRLRSRWPRHGA